MPVGIMRKRQESRSFSCNNIAFRAAALEAEAEAEAAAGEDAEISANPPPPFSANPPPPEAPMKRSTSESDLSAFDPVSALKTARSALVAGHFSPRSQSPITSRIRSTTSRMAAGWGKIKEESRKSLEMFRPRPGSASFHFPNVRGQVSGLPNGQQSDAVAVDVTGWDFVHQRQTLLDAQERDAANYNLVEPHRAQNPNQFYLYVFGGIALVIVMAFLFLQLGPSSGSQGSTQGAGIVPHRPSVPPSAPAEDEIMVDVVPFGRRNL